MRDLITITKPVIFPALVVERWTPIDNIVGRNYPARGPSELGYSFHITSREVPQGRQWYLRISHSEQRRK